MNHVALAFLLKFQKDIAQADHYDICIWGSFFFDKDSRIVQRVYILLFSCLPFMNVSLLGVTVD